MQHCSRPQKKILKQYSIFEPTQNELIDPKRPENMSLRMTKPTKWHVRRAKTQISLGFRPVWSVFAVRMKKAWVLSNPLSAQRSLQTGQMPRLIRVFAGRTVILLVLSWGGSYNVHYDEVCVDF